MSKSRRSCLALLTACQILVAGRASFAEEAKNGATAKNVEIRVEPEVKEANLVATVDDGASINPKLLAAVDDTAPGISPNERQVYFRGLKLAQEIPVAKLREIAAEFLEQRRHSNPKYAKAPAKDFPQFVDLVENPDPYRGRPVTVRGTLRRLTKLDVGKNAFGIEDVFEGWLYTADSNSNPTVVLFTRKPAGLDVGSNITEEIQATGYFLKLYGYEAQKGPEIAPMLLAGTVELNPGPRPYVFKALSPSLYVILTLSLLVIGFGIWKANRPGHVEKLFTPEHPDLSNIRPDEGHH
jgi:hypothetical protein